MHSGLVSDYSVENQAICKKSNIERSEINQSS